MSGKVQLFKITLHLLLMPALVLVDSHYRQTQPQPTPDIGVC